MSVDTTGRVRSLRRGDPERLGVYRLVGRLGQGGMGVVYLGLDADGEYVAVKLVHAALADDPEFRGRFRSEVERARQVPSFCTTEVLDADLDHQPPYLVVEYVDGPSLAEVVQERGPLTAANLHSVAVGVATALTGIHGAGVIHRDLKPSNVLLAPGSPKVIDFGIARAFEATSQFTRTDQMVGTVAYMAPERFSAEPGTHLTAAADIFAWGCVVGYAGTGKTPFHGDSTSATAARILTQPPHLAGMAEPLRGLVELALAKEPEDRPTARELLDMLLGDQPVPRYAPAVGGTQTVIATMDRAGPLQPAYDYDDHSLRDARPALGWPDRNRAFGRTRWLALLAAWLVIASIVTVVVVLGAADKFGSVPVTRALSGDGGLAAGGAAGPTAGPPVEPTGGEVILRDPLSQPGLWRRSEIPEQNATCFPRGVLVASRIGSGEYQCRGPDQVIEDDFGVEVTTALQNEGSCAAIWFHWTPRTGGHVFLICENSVSVAADLANDQRVFGTQRLAQQIGLRRPFRVHLVVRDGRADIYRNGTFVATFKLPAKPDAGQVLLGVRSAARGGDAAPYAATFVNVEIRSL